MKKVPHEEEEQLLPVLITADGNICIARFLNARKTLNLLRTRRMLVRHWRGRKVAPVLTPWRMAYATWLGSKPPDPGQPFK